MSKQLNPEMQHRLGAISKELIEDGVGTSDIPLMEEPQPLSISYTLWEVLAYDLALDYIPENDILDSYDITPHQLALLKENEHFCRILEEKQQEVKQLGSTDASHAIQFRLIAQRGAKHFLDRLTDDKTSNKDFLNMFKAAIGYARLDPDQDKSGDSGPITVSGHQMIFNISGVPGLEHLNPPNTKNVTPDNIEEAEVIEHVKIQEL